MPSSSTTRRSKPSRRARISPLRTACARSPVVRPGDDRPYRLGPARAPARATATWILRGAPWAARRAIPVTAPATWPATSRSAASTPATATDPVPTAEEPRFATVECIADATQKLYATSDCSGEPIFTIPPKEDWGVPEGASADTVLEPVGELRRRRDSRVHVHHQRLHRNLRGAHDAVSLHERRVLRPLRGAMLPEYDCSGQQL